MDLLSHAAPDLWLPITVACYALAVWLQRLCGGTPFLNPLLFTILAVATLLTWSGTPYPLYRQAMSILDQLLGTAVVALAVPLYGLVQRFGARVLVLLPALVVGGWCGTTLAIQIATRLGASTAAIATVAPRTATAAIAAEISRVMGGIPAATALVCIASGVLGATLGPSILAVVGARSPAARGIAYGTVSHATGTARAFSESEETGAWSTLAMCLTAAIASILVPLLLSASTVTN